MDAAKREKIKKLLLFSYLVLFPFGQLAGGRIRLFDFVVPLQATDFVIALFVLLSLFDRKKSFRVFRGFGNFGWAVIASLLFSLLNFDIRELFIGLLYLIRLLTYGAFFIKAFAFIRESPKLRAFVAVALVYLAIFIAIFGLFQYLFLPDVRAFQVWGWDDHLFRLVGTFMDPGFTSLFLVFGVLAALGQLSFAKDRKMIIALLILLLALALTYSRAGYVALVLGVATFFLARKNLKKILLVAGIFALMVYLIPSFGSEGVRLNRTSSIFARLENYSQSLDIFRQSPVFGIGYNNLCLAKEKYLAILSDWESHACSGLDSSLLLVLATTGVVGFLIFLNLAAKLLIRVPKKGWGLVFVASLVALLVHSLFTNSLFYPWTLGYLALLFAISFKGKN